MTLLFVRNVVTRLRIIVALLLLAPALLTGCSALRFGYNQAPELAFWWLDGYADFDEAQSRQARERIAQWFSWHRRSQLPDVAALLARTGIESHVTEVPANLEDVFVVATTPAAQEPKRAAGAAS